MSELPTQPRRQAQNDKLVATFKKNGRQSYRVSFRPDGGDGKAIITLIDRDPFGIERHVCGLAVRSDLIPSLVNALHAAELAAKSEDAR